MHLRCVAESLIWNKLLVSNRHRVNHLNNVYHHSGAEARGLLVIDRISRCTQ